MMDPKTLEALAIRAWRGTGRAWENIGAKTQGDLVEFANELLRAPLRANSALSAQVNTQQLRIKELENSRTALLEALGENATLSSEAMAVMDSPGVSHRSVWFSHEIIPRLKAWLARSQSLRLGAR